MGSRPKKSFFWILPIVLIFAGAAWMLLGGSRQGEILKNVVSPALNAHITIVANPAGKVFMDGELMGNAGPTLDFEVKPGLHKLEVKNPKFVSRKFIVELESGEEKSIEVKFGNR